MNNQDFYNEFYGRELTKLKGCLAQLDKPFRYAPDGCDGVYGVVYDKIKMDCYNKQDVEELKSQLTGEEKGKVIFTWLEWSNESENENNSTRTK